MNSSYRLLTTTVTYDYQLKGMLVTDNKNLGKLSDLSEADLLKEFEELLHVVSEDISRSAVLPSISATQDHWHAQLKKFQKEFSATQEMIRGLETISPKFNEAIGRMLAICDKIQEQVNQLAEQGQHMQKQLTTFSHFQKLFEKNRLKLEKLLEKIIDIFKSQLQSIRKENAKGLQHMQSVLADLDTKADEMNRLMTKLNTQFIESKRPILFGMTQRSLIPLILFFQLVLCFLYAYLFFA